MTEAVIPLPETTEPWNVFVFDNYVNALRGNSVWYGESGNDSGENLVMGWYRTRLAGHQLHTSVRHMVDNHRPADFKKLAMEFATISKTDEMRISYVRSPADGANDRELVTSIGKYLARHWPHVPDHVRRDAQALHTIDERVIVDTRADIILTVEEGPRSCMASAHGSIRWRKEATADLKKWLLDKDHYEPVWEDHPYVAYAPELGWSMAQRWSTSGGQGRRLDGRALIYSEPEILRQNGYSAADLKGVFVRTYARNKTDPVGGYSETDHMLQSWLEKQGYAKVDQWPFGAKLRTKTHNDAERVISLPYVDGEARVCLLPPVAGMEYRLAELVDRDFVKMIGNFDPRDTSGFTSVDTGGDDDDEDDDPDNDYHSYCDDCDDRFHHDDMRHVGRDEDRHVCDSCCSNNYTEVRGLPYTHQRGVDYTEYYVNNEDADHVRCINARSFYIDNDYPPAMVVQLECGDWALQDETVCIDGEWYLDDETDYVTLEDGEYAMRGDACEINDEWYIADNCYQAVDGTWFLEEEDRDAHDVAQKAEKAAQDIELATPQLETT